MKQIVVFLAAVVLLSACTRRRGSGSLITKQVTVGEFTGIETGGTFEVEFTTAPAYTVELEVDDNLMDLVEAKVSGGVLQIRIKSGTSISREHLKATVTAPGLELIKASGAAQITATNLVKGGDRLRIDVSGAAKVTAEVDAASVAAEASGASDIELQGRTREQKLHASGSATIDNQELKSETARVEASGSGTVHVFASVKVNASASGAASVYCSGGGAINSDVSGAGSVKPE